jgi:hypothetical protein
MTDNEKPAAAPTTKQTQPAHSYLIIDCGHSNTTAALFDVVDGVYRFIARGSSPTTAGTPWDDVIYGIQQAAKRIMETTGRLLLSEQGVVLRPARPDGVGVDYFGIVTSAAAPLRTVVVGLLEDVSVASARRVLQTIYGQEIDCFSLSDGRIQQVQIDALVKCAPDLVLITGGNDGGSDLKLMNLVNTVALAASVLDEARKPVVLFAGNRLLRAKVTEALGGIARLHVADNVRPQQEVEQLDSAVNLVSELYESEQVGAIPGIEEILGWSSFRPLPTAHAFAGILEYFAHLYRGRVLGLDVGSDSITFVSADPEQLRLSVRSDLGSGSPVARMVRKSSPEEILRWTTDGVTPAGLLDFAFNKSLRPQTTPLVEEELILEQAIGRKAIAEVVDGATASWGWSKLGRIPPFRLLVLRGGAFTNTPRPGQALLMALNALQPVGVFAVAMDRYGVLPAVGLLAPHNPLAAVQVLEGGVLEDLGWVIVPEGRARPGQTVMNVRMESEETGTLQMEVTAGTLEILPLAPGRTAEVHLKPARRIDIGQGPGKEQRIRVEGGAVGLVIDARGRPIELPDDEAKRHKLLRQWIWDVGG